VTPRSWRRFSLRRTLLVVLLPGMLLVVGAELWSTWRSAIDAANAAYDRSLYGAIKAIDANISIESGGLSVELPYRMLEFFQLTAGGQVFFRVATEDGLVEIGDAELPRPPPLATGKPHFDDSAYFGQAVRIGSYARPLAHPIAGAVQAQRVVIQVAETLGSRREFTRALVLQAVGRDVALVVVAALLLVLVVAWALRPLERLRNEVRSRSPQDLAPIATDAIPADVRPLVEAINHHVERNRHLVEARRRFIDDASHQLRTPLTTLTTQMGFALRQTDPAQLRDVLHALKAQLDETIRQTNQMLALARADSVAEVAAEPLDLVAFTGDVTRAWWPEARQREIDLGLDAPEGPLRVQANPGLLKEALGNLLHNAIRYTPRGGQVTVRVEAADAWARLSVIDNGPGIPQGDLQRASERFFRASNVQLPGSGLGLAIARSIAERHGGRLVLQTRTDEPGLVATVELPLPTG
jgi:two-component system sensor histidine kinase TctE